VAIIEESGVMLTCRESRIKYSAWHQSSSICLEVKRAIIVSVMSILMKEKYREEAGAG